MEAMVTEAIRDSFDDIAELAAMLAADTLKTFGAKAERNIFVCRTLVEHNGKVHRVWHTLLFQKRKMFIWIEGENTEVEQHATKNAQFSTPPLKVRNSAAAE